MAGERARVVVRGAPLRRLSETNREAYHRREEANASESLKRQRSRGGRGSFLRIRRKILRHAIVAARQHQEQVHTDGVRK